MVKGKREGERGRKQWGRGTRGEEKGNGRGRRQRGGGGETGREGEG